jgi:hypothetical protein
MIRVKGDWVRATKKGDDLPLVCDEGSLLPGSPVERWDGLGRAYYIDATLGRHRLLNPDDLDGATDVGGLLSYPATPGEFAARWNAWTPERREAWLREAIRNAEIATRQRS